MARLVAGFGTSHSPMLAAQLADWQNGAFLSRDRARRFVDFDGNPCRYEDLLTRTPADAAARMAPGRLAERHATVQEAIARLRADLTAAELDVLIVVGDDQEELFDHSNMPAICVFRGQAITNARATEARDPLARARMRFQEDGADVDYPCHPGLADHLIASLQTSGFDLSVMNVLPAGRTEGHAYSYIHRFCMGPKPVPMVPLFLNAYYPPNQPTPARCHALGEALARAIAAYPANLRIGVLASGGLSHFLVDEDFDNRVLLALRHRDADFFRTAPLSKLQHGSSEIRNWICLAGAVGELSLRWITYVPGYRTPALTGTGLGFASFA
jgi:hypothetical protein